MNVFSSVENVVFATETCCECGVQFAMTHYFQQRRLENGGIFFCPNGHQQCYRKPTVIELREKLEEKERELRAQKCETIRQTNLKEAAERKLKRVGNGVCPCCNRSFKNLKRHIETKHKGVVVQSKPD